jgi:hypothetical protein
LLAFLSIEDDKAGQIADERDDGWQGGEVAEPRREAARL